MWAATGPVVEFLDDPECAPLAQFPAVASPKLQLYSMSWNGRVVTPPSVVPDASKKTASGATPEVRAGARDRTRPLGTTLGVVVVGDELPFPPHETRPKTANNNTAKQIRS